MTWTNVVLVITASPKFNARNTQCLCSSTYPPQQFSAHDKTNEYIAYIEDISIIIS